MKAFFAPLGVLVVLSGAPALAQTAVSDTMPPMGTLNAAERAELQNRYRNAESELERNKVRAQIQERIRTQDMLNRELSPGHRNQLTAQEQQQIRQRLGEAQSDAARQGIIAQAQEMATQRIQARTQNTQRTQHQEQQATRPNSGGFGAKQKLGNGGFFGTGRSGSGNFGGGNSGGGRSGGGSGGRR